MPDHFVLWNCLLCWTASAILLAWFSPPLIAPSTHLQDGLSLPCLHAPHSGLSPLTPSHPSLLFPRLLPLPLIPAACLCKLEMAYRSSECSQIICCGILWAALMSEAILMCLFIILLEVQNQAQKEQLTWFNGSWRMNWPSRKAVFFHASLIAHVCLFNETTGPQKFVSPGQHQCPHALCIFISLVFSYGEH